MDPEARRPTPIVDSVLTRVGTPERTPLVVSVPHGGRCFPAELRHGLTVDPDDLWSDWRTDVLFDFGSELGIPTVINRLSRFVADPNRDPAGALHGSFWSTVVPATDPWGVELYTAPLDEADLERRVRTAHRPFHDALERLVRTSLEHHPRVLLLDLHSFGLPLDAEVVVGDRAGTTARPDASTRVIDAFRRAAFRVEHDLRFPGGRIVDRWRHDERVDALQIELDQRRYLHADDVDRARPHPRPDDTAWLRTRDALRGVLQQLGAP